jgi:hypothetical protein
MIDFGGAIYYLDIDKFTELVKMDDNAEDKVYETVIKTFKDENGKVLTTEEYITSKERDIFINTNKYEMFRLMVDIVLDDFDDADDALGSERALSKALFSYKLAFNTLLHYGILVEIEE